MKDYLYYLFDEKLSGEGLSNVKERISATGAKVIDLSPTKKGIMKRLKELKGSKKYALLIGNDVETQHIALKAEVDFCGWLDGTTSEAAFQQLPYRKLLNDIRLLPLMRQRYPYQHKGKIGWMLMKYSRWVHFKQIRGLSHKAKHNVNEFVCQNCGETYSGNYCPTCGQTHKVKRFDLANITKELIVNALDFEHGFLRTLLELFWRPGYMMRDYLDGHRIDYNKPFKAIFVLATIYLIAAHLLDPASFAKKEEVRIEDLVTTSNKLSEAFTESSFKPWLDEIKNLSDTLVALKKEEDALRAEQMTDSILRAQGKVWRMSTQDSLFVVNRVRRGMARTDGQKLSEIMADEEELPGFFGWAAKLSLRNMEVIEKFEDKYFHEGTLLYSMYELLDSFFSMNKAVTIILMIPLMVFCARRSFRTTLVGMRTNLAEYIMVFTIFGSQILWVQLFSLLATQQADFSSFMDLGVGFVFLTWDMKQFFNLGWKNALKRTLLYMYGYAIVFAILMTFVLSALGSFLMWIMYQIT